MANQLYGKGREAFLNKDIDMLADNIKCVLVDLGTYTASLDVDEHHDDLSGIVATSGNLASKTTTLGVFDAADVTFSSVTGATVEAIVIYRDSGTSSTSELIAYIDTATGLAVTPNGGDISIAWDSGANKIFKL
tara:strand:+ start:1373 stop:1774 length:402 start_codon:yes stop_codon:yes gene_type:complete